MYCKIWLRGDLVYIPTVVVTEDGILLSDEPIAILSADDTEAIIAVLRDKVSRDNIIIPAPSHEERERDDAQTLRAFGFKTWPSFMKNSQLWHIYKLPEAYKIIGTRRSPHGGFEADPDKIEFLPLDTSLDDLCARAITIVQGAVGGKPAVRRSRPTPVPKTGPVRLPRGPRVDELGDFLEWLANAEPQDEADIRGEIKRYYYDHGDREAGDALNQALDMALTPGITRAARQDILTTCERYTRYDPAHRRKS